MSRDRDDIEREIYDEIQGDIVQLMPMPLDAILLSWVSLWQDSTVHRRLRCESVLCHCKDRIDDKAHQIKPIWKHNSKV